MESVIGHIDEDEKLLERIKEIHTTLKRDDLQLREITYLGDELTIIGIRLRQLGFEENGGMWEKKGE